MMDSVGFLKKLRQTIPPEDGQNIIFAFKREPLIWQQLQEATYFEKVFQLIGNRIEGWNPMLLALIAMDLHNEADQLLHQPLLPLDSELFKSAIDSYEETLSTELPPDSLARAGLLALALRERFLLKDSWEGLADEIQTRKTNSSAFYIWKTPLTCAFAFAPEPLKFLNGLIPSSPTKILDFFHLIIYILFFNPLADQAREELIFQLITLRSPEEQIAWLNLLEKEGHLLLARKLSTQLLDRFSTITRANNLNRPLAVDPLLDKNIIHEINESQQLTSYQRLTGNEELAYKSLEKVFELSGILHAQIKNQLAQIDKNIQGSNYLRFFEEVNELIPHSSLSRLQLANELLSANRLPEALQYLPETGCDIYAKLTAARIAIACGNIPQLNAIIEDISAWQQVDNAPNVNTSYFCDLGQSLLNLGLPDQASILIGKGREIYPTDPELIILALRAYTASGHHAESEATAYLSVLMQPGDISAQKQMADILEHNEEWSEAFEERKRIISSSVNPSPSDLLRLAYCALQVNDQNTTISICNNLLIKDPENSEANLYIGIAFLENNDTQTAVNHLVQATILSPDNPTVWLKLANAYERSENQDKAVATLHTASNLIPLSMDIQLELAKLLLNQGNISEALCFLKKAHSLDPLSSEAAFVLCQTHFKLGEYEEANCILEEIRQEKSLDINLSLLHGQILVKLNRCNEAWSAFQTGFEIPNCNCDTLIAYGQSVLSLSKQKQFPAADLPQNISLSTGSRIDVEKAILAVHTAVAMNPANIEGRLLLADLLFINQQFDSALDQYIELTKLTQTKDTEWNWKILFGEGKAALKLGNVDTALASLQEAATIKPNEVKIHRTLAEVFLQANLPGEVSDTAQTALFLAPQNFEVLIWYAEMMEKIGQFPNAISSLEKAIQIYPDRNDILLHLAKDEYLAGNKDIAKEIILSVTNNHQASCIDLDQAAHLCLDIGSINDAIVCMEKALEKDPTPSSATRFQSLAKAYEETGNLTSAIATLQHVIDQQKDDLDIYRWKINLLIKQGNLAGALLCVKDALCLASIQPDSKKELCILAAQLYRKEGQPQSAFKQIKDILIDTPNDLELISLNSDLAFSLYEDDEYQVGDQWKNWLISIGDEENNNPQKTALLKLLFTLAEAALEHNNFEKANEIISEIRSFSSDMPRLLAIQSRIAGANSDFAHAQELYDSANSLYSSPNVHEGNTVELAVIDPAEEFWIPLSLGEAAFNLQLWQRSLAFFKQASDLAPNEPIAQIRYCRALVLCTELQRNYQPLNIITHIPGKDVLSEANFYALMNKLSLLQENIEVIRWRLRAQTAVNPTLESAAILSKNIHDSSDAAALISALLTLGEVESAQKIIGEYPDNIEVQFASAVGMLSTDPEYSHGIGSILTKQLPSDPLCYALLAFSNHENLIESSSSIEAALSFWPDEPKWHEFAAENYYQMKDFVLSIQHWEEALQLEPNNSRIIFAIGKIYHEVGEYEKAILFYERMLKLDPENQEAWQLLAQVNRSIGNIPKAFEQIEIACSFAKASITSLILFGQIALELDHKDIALQNAQRILETDPNNLDGIILYSRAMESMGFPAEALSFIEQALPRINSPYNCLVEQARLIHQVSGSNQALPYYHELAQNYPGKIDVLTPYAEILVENNQLDQGETVCQNSLQIDPAQPNLHLLLGRLQRAKGQLDQAIFHLCEAIRQSPNLIEAYLELGRAYHDRRDHSQAIKTYRQATHVAPNDPRPYYNAGLVLKECKDYLGAEKMLRYAAKFSPDDVTIHRQLAAIIAINLVHNPYEVSIRQ